MIVRIIARFMLLILCTATCAGCGISEIRRQSLIIGDMGVLKGIVTNGSSRNGQVLVAIYTENKGIFSLRSIAPTNARSEYQFAVVPGTFYLATFVDENNDGMRQPGEPWTYYGKPTGISVSSNQNVTTEPMVVSGEPHALPGDMKVEVDLNPFVKNIGRIVHLDDPIFNSNNYSLGMWRPIDFTAQGRGGLLFLQEYEKDKIPVLFIHGVNGGPTDLKSLIGKIDRKRFQPWVLYYPSGVRLNLISEYLVKAIATVQSRHGVKKFIVVGHSMGGLVTRSFVKKYVEQYPERLDNILMGMTINSPLGGMPSATNGLNAPFMIQCWRDVAPGSYFLKEIHAWDWPQGIPYYLIFSHELGKDNDGVVALESQIPLKLQQEAAHMYGFTNSHVGTLLDDSFLNLFSKIFAGVQ